MISISEEMKVKRPTTAAFCELINYALEKCPDMTLAEFAAEIENGHKEERLERIIAAEKKQFGVDDEDQKKKIGRIVCAL